MKIEFMCRACIKHYVRSITYCTDEKVNERIATGFCSYLGIYENINKEAGDLELRT